MNILTKVGAVLAVGTITGFGLSKISSFSDDFIVKNKYVKSHPYYFGGDKYMVELENTKGQVSTFRTGVNPWELNFNRKGVFDDIDVGKTCKITGYGYNYPKFHLYQNITNIYPKEDNKMDGVEETMLQTVY